MTHAIPSPEKRPDSLDTVIALVLIAKRTASIDAHDRFLRGAAIFLDHARGGRKGDSA